MKAGWLFWFDLFIEMHYLQYGSGNIDKKSFSRVIESMSVNQTLIKMC